MNEDIKKKIELDRLLNMVAQDVRLRVSKKEFIPVSKNLSILTEDKENINTLQKLFSDRSIENIAMKQVVNKAMKDEVFVKKLNDSIDKFTESNPST